MQVVAGGLTGILAFVTTKLPAASDDDSAEISEAMPSGRPNCETSPRVGSGRCEESARGTILGQERQSHGLGRSFFNRLMPSKPVKVGRGVAGVRGVHLDCGLAQFVGELDGQHVHRGLGGVVSEQLERREFPIRGRRSR